MCGIIGIWAKNNNGKTQIECLPAALKLLKHRGPNHQGYKLYSNCGFGHVRLSIIDTDERSNQPFISDDQRYTLVFNGEIYNYLELKKDLLEEGITFKTTSDTEVLLQLLIHKGKDALQLLNGFFAFAFYDHHKNTVLIARDRIGIKPVMVYEDEDKILFSSELHPFEAFDLDKEIDPQSLNYYFGLTYTPFNFSILKKVRKIEPGNYLSIDENGVNEGVYYKPNPVKYKQLDYERTKSTLQMLLKRSVRDRMVADVPLGCFLSGGIDSSIIAALAIQENKDLKTFSVGFDHAYFNETKYANEVAEKIGSQHTVFLLTQKDFKENFHSFLGTIDEPFADSSAFAVYLLALKTKQKVTVALSGDGADELFGGYRKHSAEYRIRKMGKLKKSGVKFAAQTLKPFKNNRSDKFGELNRKIQKLSKGVNLDASERYWQWCQFIDANERKQLLKKDFMDLTNPLLDQNWEDLNSILFADQKLVLPYDMLKKVDLMSMASALEVRTPFLDHKLVEYVNKLPASFKVNEKGGKRLLKDAFADLLPTSVLERSKKGFEIPIKEWLNDEITDILNGPLFQTSYLEKQNLFNATYIKQIAKEWGSSNFGDRIYLVWALIVFQHWWDRTLRCF